MDPIVLGRREVQARHSAEPGIEEFLPGLCVWETPIADEVSVDFAGYFFHAWVAHGCPFGGRDGAGEGSLGLDGKRGNGGRDGNIFLWGEDGVCGWCLDLCDCWGHNDGMDSKVKVRGSTQLERLTFTVD